MEKVREKGDKGQRRENGRKRERRWVKEVGKEREEAVDRERKGTVNKNTQDGHLSEAYTMRGLDARRITA